MRVRVVNYFRMMAWLPVVVTCLCLMGICGGTTSSLYKVAYQVMMNSLITEERVRSEGQSGVKQVIEGGVTTLYKLIRLFNDAGLCY